MEVIQITGLIASIVLPLWNIPLIIRIIKRGSSNDISRSWALGVWSCLLLMLPSGLTSVDIVWRTFSIVNITLFTLVVITVLKYHQKKIL